MKIVEFATEHSLFQQPSLKSLDFLYFWPSESIPLRPDINITFYKQNLIIEIQALIFPSDAEIGGNPPQINENRRV